MQLESDIEKRLVQKVENLGGMCLKFTSPGAAGVPDRIVLFSGRVDFVELKRPGGKPRPLQKYWLDKIRRQGIGVAVLSTKDEVDAFCEDLASRWL